MFAAYAVRLVVARYVGAARSTTTNTTDRSATVLNRLRTFVLIFRSCREEYVGSDHGIVTEGNFGFMCHLGPSSLQERDAECEQRDSGDHFFGTLNCAA